MIPIRDDNPSHGLPAVTIGLIAINVLIFLVEIMQGSGMDNFIWKYGYVPPELVHGSAELRREMIEKAPPVMDRFGIVQVDRNGDVITRPGPYQEATAVPAWINIFTCMFLHAGWGHLLGNMLYLWIFGNNVEYRLGPLLFLVFYLATGVAGNLLHTMFDQSIVPLVGASGAISGVMGGYVLLFPKSRILAVVPPYFYTIKMPAWIFLGIYFVLQNLYPALGGAMSGQRTSNVAFLAHIGGFIAGAALIFILPRRPAPAYAQPARAIDDDDADIII